MCVNILYKMGSIHKELLQTCASIIVLRKSIWECFSCNLNWTTFSNDKLFLLEVVFFWKVKKQACHFKKNQHILLSVKFEFSSKNRNFRKLEPSTMNELESFPILKTVLLRSVGIFTSFIFYSWLIKFSMQTHIWKICTTQRTSIFQITSAWCYKTTHR